jgi:hypothetical protein
MCKVREYEARKIGRICATAIKNILGIPNRNIERQKRTKTMVPDKGK